MHKFLTVLFAAAAITTAAALPSGSFKPSGNKLLDANGNEFIMRGCNYSWAWQSGHENTVIPAAKRIGCNTIRIQLSDGKKGYWRKPSVSELENLIKLCEDNKLIAIFNFHDETGSNSIDDLRHAANTWSEYKDVLNRHLSTVLVNISNEWFGQWNKADQWAEGYIEVIPKMRAAGIKNTLVVDCAGYGQWPKSMFLRGADVAAADNLNNTIFSMHFYQDAAGTETKVRDNINFAMQMNFPVIIGEVAYRHQGYDIAWQTVLDYTKEKGMGFLVWSWTGNGGGTDECDMFGSYDDSQWKDNGTNLVKGRNGIAETSVECSVFGSTPGPKPDPDPDPEPDPEPDPSGEMIVVASHSTNAPANAWTADINVPAGIFEKATAHSTIRLHFTASGNAQMQFVVKTPPNYNWTKLNECDNVSAPYYDIKVSQIPAMQYGVSTQTALDGLKFDGLWLKGDNFTLTKCELLNPKPNGIDDASADPTTIDWNAPLEIYNLQGIPVEEMTPGHIYIVRQGSIVKKIVK